MKKLLFYLIFIYLFIGVSPKVIGQVYITPYDKIPGVINIDKPSYDESYPSWAKLLYEYPINFNKIETQFHEYMKDNEGEKNAVIRYYKLWREIIVEYIDISGTIHLPKEEDIKNSKRSFLKQSEKSSIAELLDASNSNWSFLGPKTTQWLGWSSATTRRPTKEAPWQVNVYSFDVFKGDNDIIYAGTESGYVNKSVDKGQNWTMLAPNYVFSAVAKIAIHPTDSNIVYASGGGQLHKTIDGGVTWTPLLNGATTFSANHIIIDPVNPNKILISSFDGIYISTNGGNSWLRKLNLPTYDIEFMPGNTNTIYTLAKGTSDNFELYSSTNGGTSFFIISSFPPNVAVSNGGLIAVTPANPNLIIANMLSTNKTPFIYNGELNSGTWEWTQVVNPSAYDNGQGYYDLVLEISPNNENEYFIGTTSLFKTKNGGTSFVKIGGYGGKFSIHPDIQDMQWLPGGDVWVATDGGMNISSNAFETSFIPRIKNLVGSPMWGFDQGWNEDIVVGGRYHNGNTAMADFYNGVALRMGGAESPTGWVLQGKSRHVVFSDLSKKGHILPSTETANTEGNFNFSKFPNMKNYGGRRGDLLHHPNYFETLFLGEGNDFWKSENMGVTFESLYTFSGLVMGLQISIKKPNVIYASVEGSGLYKSEDEGKTWTLKPSLASSTNGGGKTRGNTSLVISPYNENVIYATYSNSFRSGTQSAVYKSTDGGDTWVNWSGTLNGLYTKKLTIQPTNSGEELIYLFTTTTKSARNQAEVYYRKVSDSDWSLFANNHPSNFKVTTAIPFYRDGKIRLAGHAGVWESPLQEPSFKPIVNPWVERKNFNCSNNVAQFDDHSILNHTGASWKWEISPAPKSISDPNIRNPIVEFETPGSYDVTLKVTQNGIEYSKTISNMVTYEPGNCTSINNCSNPGELPKNEFTLLSVDSQTATDLATNSFDGDPNTKWHTKWQAPADSMPHEIQIDLGNSYEVSKFEYLARQDDNGNGRVKDFELYFSHDKTNWGTVDYTGSFTDTGAPQKITLATPASGRYMKFKILSQKDPNKVYAVTAEITLTGCLTSALSVDNEFISNILAYPIPFKNYLYLKVDKNLDSEIKVNIYSILGQKILSKKVPIVNGKVIIDGSQLTSGMYVVKLKSNNMQHGFKVIKQ